MPVSVAGGERPNERSDSVIDDDADFVKLFVGQIPKDMNEDILLPFFAEFGPVAELTVIRDKVNQSHKGLLAFCLVFSEKFQTCDTTRMFYVVSLVPTLQDVLF